MVRTKHDIQRRGATTARKSVYPISEKKIRPHGNFVSNRPIGRKSSIPIPKIPNKPRRLRPGERVLQEIRQYQNANKHLIPKAPFCRLVREIASGLLTDVRFYNDAIEALQEATENYLTQLFEDATLCAHHGNRVTVFIRDIKLVQKLRAPSL